VGKKGKEKSTTTEMEGTLSKNGGSFTSFAWKRKRGGVGRLSVEQRNGEGGRKGKEEKQFRIRGRKKKNSGGKSATCLEGKKRELATR